MKLRSALAWLALLVPAAAHDGVPDALVADLVREVEALRAELAGVREREERRLDAARVLQAPPTAQELVDAAKQDIGGALDSCWMILCGALVMFMHAGFAMLETGSCRAKNASNVLLKNLMNVCVGTLAWYLFGWGFAYGGPKNEDGNLDNTFIGTKEFAANGFMTTDADGNITPVEGGTGQSLMLSWFFQWAFCTAAATIVSGGVAERVKSQTYGAYSFVMAGFIYPVVVAWTWGYGWLITLGGVGFMDFAGSGIVHLTGGVSALAGAVVLGPRRGRFDAGKEEEFAPHNMPLVALGTLSLWFGWYGFNCGSTLGLAGDATGAADFSTKGAMAAQVAMNTTLSAATGGITAFALFYAITKLYDVSAFCNGILAGLVSITAGCGNMDCGSAIVTGMIGACFFVCSSIGQKKLKIDDPVDASSVHGAAGIWGVMACGLFDWGNGFDHYHGWSGFSCVTDADTGACVDGYGATAIGVQLAMILVIKGGSKRGVG